MLAWLLLIYMIIYLLAAFVWRSLMVWRQTGINPYVWGSGDTPHDFIGRLFRLLVVASIGVVGFNLMEPDLLVRLGQMDWLQHPSILIAGGLLLVISLVWIVIAQIQMGESWRIGIDSNQRTNLVKIGLFRFSRNPIFLGMRLNLLGLFLFLPNALTLLIWVVGDILMQIQVRLEEEFLTKTHGEAYITYCKQTHRWI